MNTERGQARFPELDWLIGEWQGYGKFPNRTTYIHKRFSYEIRGTFLVERTLDMFPPPETSTEFEIHQDIVMYYRDGEKIKAKGFYVEAFVNSFDVIVEESGSRIMLSSTSIENGPEGMRVRTTYSREQENRFIGTFEIAMPGSEFTIFENLVMDRIS